VKEEQANLGRVSIESGRDLDLLDILWVGSFSQIGQYGIFVLFGYILFDAKFSDGFHLDRVDLT